MGAPGLTRGASRTSVTAAIDSGTRSRPPLAACGITILLTFAGLWITTLLGAAIGTAAPALSPGGRPHPTLHGSLNELVSITATNARVLSAPFLLALFRFPDHRRTRQVGDAFTAGLVAGNALRAGIALGRWQARLLPYVPQLPLEWLAAALAAAAWLTLRTGAQRQTALTYLAAVLVLVAAAAAVETLATPHITARREEPASSGCAGEGAATATERRSSAASCGSGGLPSPNIADRPPGSFKVDRRLPSPRLKARFRIRPPAGVSGFVNHRIPTRREPQMSASAPAVNSVTLVGHLTADPVLKQLDDDRKVCQLRLAVNDQKGQPPMFIDVATFGSQADACAKYLAKGRAVAVTGRLVYREWEADDGTRRSRHHIIGRVQFGGRPDGEQPDDDDQDTAA